MTDATVIERHELQGVIENHPLEVGSLDQLHFRVDLDRKTQPPTLTFRFLRPHGFHAGEDSHRAVIAKLLTTMFQATAGHFGFRLDDAAFKSLITRSME